MPKLVREMLDALPEGERESALGELLVAMADIYRSRNVEPPAWLEDVASAYPEHLAFIDAVVVTEVVRFALRRAAWANAAGLAGVATELGVPLNALERVVSSVDLIGRETWEPLTEFARKLGPTAPDPGVIGLGLTVSKLPQEHRTAAREAATRAVADYLRAQGAPLPGWLEDEL